MNNKKIILGATALILGTMIIISGTQVSSLKISKSEYELKPEIQHNKNMIFFGFGNIDYITIDGEDDLKGVINGNVSIEQTGYYFGWFSYFLFIKDTVNNKIILKWTLPEKFVLKNFSGLGEIDYYQAPHGPDWTNFFLVGYFEKIITN
jgi:hypothetical protein